MRRFRSMLAYLGNVRLQRRPRRPSCDLHLPSRRATPESIMHRTFSRKLLVPTLVTPGVLLAASVALALTPEQACQKGRCSAAAKYAQCEDAAFGAFFAGGTFTKFQAALSKCHVKYTNTWVSLERQAAGTGSTCDGQRFATTLYGGVWDRLTGLEWHTDVFPLTTYSWSDALSFTPSCKLVSPDCGWRLPTVQELQTILAEPYPCKTSPCIDPIFGASDSGNYWTSTGVATEPVSVPSIAWFVNFFAGGVDSADTSNVYFARYVRRGL